MRVPTVIAWLLGFLLALLVCSCLFWIAFGPKIGGIGFGPYGT
jgi:hypothetical protein